MTTRSKSKNVRLSAATVGYSDSSHRDDAHEQSALFHQLLEHHLEQPVSDHVFKWVETIGNDPAIYYTCKPLGPPSNGEKLFRILKEKPETGQNTKDGLRLRAIQDTAQQRLVLYAQTPQSIVLHCYTLILPEAGIEAPIHITGKCILPHLQIEHLDGQQLILRRNESAVIYPFMERLKRMLGY